MSSPMFSKENFKSTRNLETKEIMFQLVPVLFLVFKSPGIIKIHEIKEEHYCTRHTQITKYNYQVITDKQKHILFH